MMTRSFLRLLVAPIALIVIASVFVVPQTLAATTVTLAPDADARVMRDTPNSNYGSSSFLRTNAASADKGDQETYMRFSVSGTSGTVQRAVLRIFAYDGSKDGPAIYTSGASWSESAITWNNRPARTSGSLGDKGSVANNVWLEYDVSSIVTGNGTYSFNFANTSSDGMNFYSREGQTKPQLVLTLGSGTPAPTATPSTTTTPAPSTTATPAPSTTATPAPSATATPVPTSHPGGMEPVAPDWVAQCPANTVPFEEQAWWTGDFGHVHAGFCAPQNLTIKGRYTMNVRLILHDNPGMLAHVQAQLDSTSYGGQTVSVKGTCPSPGTCAWDRQITMDASAYPYSGWHHLRIRATVKEPDGKELVASSFIPLYFDNGKPRKDWTSGMVINGTTDYVAGRGWYTGSNYIWSVIFDPPQAGQRISGQYRLRVRAAATDNPKPISYFVVKLDATHTDAGRIIYETTSSSTTPVDLTIDTTQLSNGWHSLLARTEAKGQAPASCSLCSGQPQTHAGVSKIWFYVNN